MKRVKLLSPLDNGYAVFPAGAVMETEDGIADALVNEGKAEYAAPGTPCRINPEGYDSCMPPDAVQQAAKMAAKAKD